jgi:hypothetical protein
MDWADRWLLLGTPWKSGGLFRSLSNRRNNLSGIDSET